MTTMEKLFVQTFERKKRIIDQVKHQINLFDHHLASICLLDGIAPPPWLLSPSFPSISSDLNEMRKEELISGILLQQSRSANPHFSSHYSVYKEPIFTARNKELPYASCTEVYASNNGTNTGDRVSALAPFPTDDTQCTFNGVPELDGSVTSPPDCTDARISDNFQNPAQSFVKIQRSKSRQRALELRNSAKANKQNPCEENAGAHRGQGIVSKINPIQYDQFDESVLAKNLDANNELFRKKSEGIESAGKETNCDIDHDRTTRSGSCSRQIGYANNEIYREESKSLNSAGKETNCDINCDRTIRSGCCGKQIGYVNETVTDDNNLSHIAKKGCLNMSLNWPLLPPNCVIGLSESFDPSVLANSSSVAEANLVDCRDGRKNSVVCCDKIADFSTSNFQVSNRKKPFEAGNTSCVSEVDYEDKKSLKKSVKHSGSNSELTKLFKSSPVIANRSCIAKKASRSKKGIKEKDSDIYVARITRSRSSQRQINSMNECLESEMPLSNKKENGVSKTNQLSDHAEKVDSGNSADGCRLTSSSSMREANNFDKFPQTGISSCVVMNGGVLLQLIDKSSQPPQQTSFIEEGINLLIPSIIQPNVLPPTEKIMAENVTDMYFNGMAETCSVTSKSNSGSTGCGVEPSKSRPPIECAVFVKPKILDFDDVEDSKLLKSFDLELENKQEDTSKKQLSPLQLSTDALAEVILNDSQEKHSIPFVKRSHKVQDISSKQEKVRKDSSEVNIKDNADLVEEITFYSSRQEVGSFISRNSSAVFVGSWSQHKRMKIASQPTDFLSPSLTVNTPVNEYGIGVAPESDAVTSPVEGEGGYVEQHVEESEIYISKLHDNEVAINLEGKGGVDASTPLHEQEASSDEILNKLAAVYSERCLLDKPEAEDPNSTAFDAMRQLAAEDNQVLLQASSTEGTIQERKYHFGGKNSLSHLSSTSPNILSEVGTDQNMPEYEGFFIDSDAQRPCTTNEGINFAKLDLLPSALRRAGAQDRLCKSTGLFTPLSHSTVYELDEALNLYRSIPNGLLESMELKSMCNMVGDESKLLNSSYSGLNEGVNNDLHVRSQPVSLLLNVQSGWDVSKPCISPIGKFWDRMPPKSGSSGKRVNSIPELPCISEENENADGIADTLLEISCPQVEMSFVKREPLADISKNSNPLTSVCEYEIQDDRSSIASMNTELGYSGTCDGIKKKLRDHNKRRFTRKNKENQNISLAGDGVKRSKGPLQKTFSKPKLSEKPGLRKGGPSLSEKEPKRNNIVSNITSFVPLVQQKQAAAVVTGKRDIKVKALEAAEAAKRLAEKKENERKIRKETLKIERAKMEEINLRHFELEKKKKDEEKKKKDADMAAKKRQREEEERKEKERKKMRVGEAKRNHPQLEKKLQIEKEVKLQAPDERANGKKEFKKIEKAKVDNNLQTVPGTKPPTITIGTINASISAENPDVLSGDSSKVMGFFGKPSENHSFVSSVSQEQSYEISPYKGSDDEDEDEDANTRNNKYKPSWASKSQLALVVSSGQQNMDPESIFSRKVSCSISEVLLPRRLQQIK